MSCQPVVFSRRWCLPAAVLASMVAWEQPGHARAPQAPAPDPLQAACTAVQATPMWQVSLLFGLNRPDGGHVSQREWTRFVRDVVTPRFPAGFSVLRMTGQWRDEHSGRIIREPSRVIWVATPLSSDLRPRLEAIRQTYRQRFGQDSVGLVVTPGCAAF
ncbi:DUF3574 domain-containing protein [Komagataeibacter sp. AV436]|uniref:DUF3574 domain-containing protein n=1 Tax=Komagataeibacter melomenusus TaxID=2766578 RepID=A0ABX2AGL3_9PROT|nr:DUF3574 domain-containing protein [Komagataeibacter melomenusus]MBV1829611.1 DUF3574 domain-containing protein [Komagataeibacter melomenusus]NPC67484.1 DUF3574 domain-containing protein [Komagataeibacter melomenusus]